MELHETAFIGFVDYIDYTDSRRLDEFLVERKKKHQGRVIKHRHSMRLQAMTYKVYAAVNIGESHPQGLDGLKGSQASSIVNDAPEIRLRSNTSALGLAA